MDTNYNDGNMLPGVAHDIVSPELEGKGRENS